MGTEFKTRPSREKKTVLMCHDQRGEDTVAQGTRLDTSTDIYYRVKLGQRALVS